MTVSKAVLVGLMVMGLFAGRAGAACSTPTANISALDFQGSVWRFCDGTNWMALGPGSVGTLSSIFERTENTTTGESAITLRRSRTDSIAPSAGTGVELLFQIEGFTNNSMADSGDIRSVWEANQTNDTTSRDAFMAFRVTQDNAKVERMRIDSNGSVGIGTTAPGQKLEVSGNILATAFLYSSDYRLKRDIVPLEGSLEKVISFSTVNFDWKSPASTESDRRQIGLIAQDVKKMYPEAVVQDQNGFLKVNYPALIAPVIDAIRELYKRLIGVDSKVAVLESKLQELEMMNNELEQRLRGIEENSSQGQPASRRSGQ